MPSKRFHSLPTIRNGFVCFLLLCGASAKALAQTITDRLRATAHHSIAVDENFVLALQKDGTLWAWIDPSRSLGVWRALKTNSPVRIGLATNWVALSASDGHALALRRDGTIWASGIKPNNLVNPVQVGRDTNWIAITAADRWSYALRRDGSVWQLHGELFSELVPPNKATPFTELGSTPGPQGIHLVAKCADQSFWSSGSVKRGYSEYRGPLYETVFAAVPEAANCLAFANCFSHSAVVLTNGTLWAWANLGNNEEKGGPMKLVAKPKQVGSETNWVDVFTDSFHTFGLRRDGTLWFWQHLFSTSDPDQPKDLKQMTSEKPQRIGTASGWNTMTVWDIFQHWIVATRNDGTLWFWIEGQSEPTRVGDLSNWGPPAE